MNRHNMKLVKQMTKTWSYTNSGCNKLIFSGSVV